MDKKIKILILSYYFPPGNMTASERIFSWAKYLHLHNIYPIIVTRNWEIDVKNSADLFKSSGTEIIHEINENYEVYFIPYKSSVKEKIFNSLYGTKFYFIYLIIAFFYGIKETITHFGSSLNPLYKFSKQLLNKDKDIKALVISANPFELFHFGYKLNKQFHIPWIADYRDDWTTNELHLSTNKYKKIIQVLSKKAELKWVNSASCFLSVSDYYVKKIQSLFPEKKSYTLQNGFIEENYVGLSFNKTSIFTITYVGSIYPQQEIEIFLKAVIILLSEKISMKIQFIGISKEGNIMNRIKRIIIGFEEYFVFTSRVEKDEVIKFQNESDLLLAISYNGLKGCPGSKLYEYIAIQKPVLICPSDKDIIEESLTETGQAIIANSVEECCLKLKQLYSTYNQSTFNNLNIKPTGAQLKFTRKEQTKILATAIKNSIN